MDRNEFVKTISDKIKVARVEANLTQDRMAEVLGISKKTLVQIEKGRVQASWPVAVSFCTLFRDSEFLAAFFGSDLLEIISVLAFEYCYGPFEKTMGGKLWWKDIDTCGKFKLQQNLVSKHFRILDDQDNRWCSSFEEEGMRKRLKELSKTNFFTEELD